MPDQADVVTDERQDVLVVKMVSRALRDQEGIAFRDLHRGELRLRPFVDAPETEADGAGFRFDGIESAGQGRFREADGIVKAGPCINGFPVRILLRYQPVIDLMPFAVQVLLMDGILIEDGAD